MLINISTYNVYFIRIGFDYNIILHNKFFNMRVFKIEPTEQGYYGCALVSANTDAEAINVFKNNEDVPEDFYDDARCIIEQIHDLDYNGTSEVILDATYCD